MNQIILSTNEDPNYMDFWKPVSWAYKKIFPDVTIHLAFLTDRSEDDELVKEFREYGKVTLFKPVPDIKQFAQAKMIRFILASMQGNNVCYIDDVDLFPLKKSFITDKTDKRPQGQLLCVGGEVYHNNGCFPVSQMTAEGYLWKRFINPNDLEYSDLIRSYRGKVMFDNRENIDIDLNFDADLYFSDERLIRRLRTVNPVPIFKQERGYTNFLEATIDRYDWKINQEKLDNHGYENAHGIRPYKTHEEKYLPLIDYINKNYAS
jgi:hypothetical protein